MSNHAMRDMICDLMHKAYSNLTDEDYQRIACLSGDAARGMTANLQSLVDGMASMISTHGQSPTGAGNFQDAESVSDLLLLIGGQLETILTMHEIETGAECRIARLRRGAS
jgi:hypothetical protein